MEIPRKALCYSPTTGAPHALGKEMMRTLLIPFLVALLGCTAPERLVNSLHARSVVTNLPPPAALAQVTEAWSRIGIKASLTQFGNDYWLSALNRTNDDVLFTVRAWTEHGHTVIRYNAAGSHFFGGYLEEPLLALRDGATPDLKNPA